MCRMCLAFTNKPTQLMHTFFNTWEKRQSDGFGYYCKSSHGNEYMLKSPHNEAFKMRRGIKTFLLHCRQKTSGLKDGNGGGEENHPFISEDESLLLTHNGCLSGYKGLRKHLTKTFKHKFASAVDSEVLLHLFEEYNKKWGMSVMSVKQWLKVLNKFNVFGTANVLCLNRETMDWFAYSEGSIVVLKPLSSKDLFVGSDDVPLGEMPFFKFDVKSGYCVIGHKNRIVRIDHIGNLGSQFSNYGYYGTGSYGVKEFTTVGGRRSKNRRTVMGTAAYPW